MRPRDLFWLGSGIALGFTLAAALPRLRKEFGPAFSEAASKAHQMATEFSTAVASQFEQSQADQPEYVEPIKQSA